MASQKALADLSELAPGAIKPPISRRLRGIGPLTVVESSTCKNLGEIDLLDGSQKGFFYVRQAGLSRGSGCELYEGECVILATDESDDDLVNRVKSAHARMLDCGVQLAEAWAAKPLDKRSSYPEEHPVFQKLQQELTAANVALAYSIAVNFIN